MEADFSTFVPSCLFSWSFPSPAADGAAGSETQDVVAEGKAGLGEDTTLAQARALSLNDARRAAVERASGIMVRGASVVYNSQIISDIVSAFSKGLIVQEELLSDGVRTEEGQVVYVSRIRARVKPLNPEARKTSGSSGPKSRGWTAIPRRPIPSFRTTMK